MESDAESYRVCQSAYTSKAEDDVTLLTNLLRDLLTGLKTEWSSGVSSKFMEHLAVPASRVKNFAKNANTMELLTFRSLEDELNAKDVPWMQGDDEDVCSHIIPATDTSEAWEDDFEMKLVKPDAMEPFLWYILLRAADDFHKAEGRYPGYTDDTLEADRAALRPYVDRILDLYKLPKTWIKKEHIFEIVRFGAAEVHTVGAFVGGAVSHIAVMLITHQYKPFNRFNIWFSRQFQL